MAKNKWFQFDMYIGEVKGEFFEDYEMIQATNLEDALQKFFGTERQNITIEKEKQDGRTFISVLKSPIKFAVWNPK